MWIFDFVFRFFYLQNFYSELSATWTDCDVQLKIFIQYTDVRCPRCFSISSCGCVCVRVARLCRCMGVRARQSICQILFRLISSLSLPLALCSFCMLNRFYSGTAFDGSQFTNAEGSKERGRDRERSEHNNANNNSLAPSLFLSLSLLLLSPVRVRVRVFFGSTIFE